jgi:hypothetical protein
VAAERRARQRLLALAAAVLVLLIVGVAAWRMHQEHAAAQDRQERAAQDRQERAGHETLTALKRAQERLDKGWRLHDLAMLREAKAEAEHAADIARGASDAVGQQVADFHAEAKPRRQLRAVLIGAVPPPAASVATLLAGRPPWAALWELARGHDWRR